MLTPPLLRFCPARPDPCSSLLLLPAVLPAKREEGALDCEPGDDGPLRAISSLGALSSCWRGGDRGQTSGACDGTSLGLSFLTCIPGMVMVLISWGCHEGGGWAGKPGLQ